MFYASERPMRNTSHKPSPWADDDGVVYKKVDADPLTPIPEPPLCLRPGQGREKQIPSRNEDLVEAISLGHDLGHTPFGHVGEEVLNELYPHGFRHNEQSLRVVDCLENDGKGLNLTWEVREGILKHSKSNKQDIFGDMGDLPSTLEAQICRIADSVAYINQTPSLRSRNRPFASVLAKGAKSKFLADTS